MLALAVLACLAHAQDKKEEPPPEERRQILRLVKVVK